MPWFQSSMLFLTIMVHLYHQWMVDVTRVFYKTMFDWSCGTLRHILFLYLMQDGTPTQRTKAVVAFLNEKFRGWVLSWRTESPRLTHSTDFNLLDFYFWAAAQNQDFQGKCYLDRLTGAICEKFRRHATAKRLSTESTRMSSSTQRFAWRQECLF